ncbi:hypothetical protein FOE78_14250 [Microlunatus elymi]|uniref:Sulfotransferase family protein n=1 Tax=Microlunatus elymi TaxID=2596828 RepID=A0A516Q0F9_9ACTN|nr:hypothetical protein [Microlunatus elymi]QDP96923.1 hypothetical protein FOE78_14250 [Microlunatus elymi]
MTSISTALPAVSGRLKAARRQRVRHRPGRPALDVAGRELGSLLSRVLSTDAAGQVVAEDELLRLRRLALSGRQRDHDGLSIAVLAILADHFDDDAARSWLPVALAQAGRFGAAVEQELIFARGRPRLEYYPIVITALQQLGRDAEAARQLRFLRRKFRGLDRQFTDIWGDDQLSVVYRRLHRRLATTDGALPVFQHLPFCAGSSMQFSLGLVVPWSRTLQISRRWGLLQVKQASALGPHEVAELMLVHQHHPYPLRLAGRQLRHFTVLRDPVSQIRSGFYKRAARDKIITTRDSKSAGFAEHADYTIRAGLTNMLAKMIVTTHPELVSAYRRRYRQPTSYTMINYEEELFFLDATRLFSEERLLRMARETLDHNFSVVGTMAHLAAGHLACTAATGAPVAHQLSHRGRSGQPTEPDQGPVERRLREANGVDQQLFDEYTERFEAHHADLIRAVEGGV